MIHLPVEQLTHKLKYVISNSRSCHSSTAVAGMQHNNIVCHAQYTGQNILKNGIGLQPLNVDSERLGNDLSR